MPGQLLPVVLRFTLDPEAEISNPQLTVDPDLIEPGVTNFTIDTDVYMIQAVQRQETSVVVTVYGWPPKDYACSSYDAGWVRGKLQNGETVEADFARGTIAQYPGEAR